MSAFSVYSEGEEANKCPEIFLAKPIQIQIPGALFRSEIPGSLSFQKRRRSGPMSTYASPVQNPAPLSAQNYKISE
jgi:hypothetical protein